MQVVEQLPRAHGAPASSSSLLRRLSGGVHLPVYDMDADIPPAMSQFRAEGRENSEGQVYLELSHMATPMESGKTDI